MTERIAITMEICPICNAKRLADTHYCPDCGFEYAAKDRLSFADLLMDQRGICTACAPTGFTECDCLTLNQTPRHMRKKQKPEPVKTEVPTPLPVIKSKDNNHPPPTQSPRPVPPAAKKKNPCSRCIAAPFICLGEFLRAVFKLIAWLITIALVVAFIGSYIYFFLFWLERQ